MSSEAAKEEQDASESPPPPQARGAMPLDWTRVQAPAPSGGTEDTAHPVRYPWDVADISKEDDDLVIVGTAGQKITKIGTSLGEYCDAPNLRQLILRSHLIRTMEGLSDFVSLELLELYDNMIDELQALNEGEGGAPGATLRVLDMSYNVIRDMTPVQHCCNLQELYLANNKLKTMAGLKGLKLLRKIDLGANRIRVMDEEQLSGMVNLEELWLGKNKIEEIQGLEKLTKLRRLDVQSNRLTFVSGLTTQVNTLEELYLAHNGIADEGAEHESGLALRFTSLTTLDLSRNQLTTTQAFSHLVTLEDLWLSGNKIATFQDVEPLSVLGTREGACLEEVYLEYNPVADEFEYRKRLKELIPSLTKIDATMIGPTHGLPSAAGGGQALTREEQLRRMQEAVIARAREEKDDNA